MSDKIDISALTDLIDQESDLVKAAQMAETGLADKVNQLTIERDNLQARIDAAPTALDVNAGLQDQINQLTAQVTDHVSTLKMVSAITSGTVAAPAAAQS